MCYCVQITSVYCIANGTVLVFVCEFVFSLDLIPVYSTRLAFVVGFECSRAKCTHTRSSFLWTCRNDISVSQYTYTLAGLYAIGESIDHGHVLFAAVAHRHLLRVYLLAITSKRVRQTGHDDEARRIERHQKHLLVAGGWCQFECNLYAFISNIKAPTIMSWPSTRPLHA